MTDISRIIQVAEERGVFVTLEDGFVYYWPFGPRVGGAISARELRQLADELDRRNEAWNNQINEYFGNEP